MTMDDVETMTNKTLAEKHLRKFGSFLEGHSRRLLQVVESRADRRRDGAEDDATSYVKVYSKIHHIWDAVTCPIHLSWAPVPDGATGFEEIICIPLPPEGNPDVAKVLLVLTSLTNQLSDLRERARTKFLVPLLLYGDGFEEDGGGVNSEGDGHISISNFVPVLYQLQGFIKMGKELCVHWISQVGALFKDSKPHVVSISSLGLPSVFRAFGDFLAILIILDEVISGQFVLQEHWSKYRQMIGSVRVDSSSFGADEDKLALLERDMFLLEKDIVSGSIFKNVLTDLGHFGGKTFGKGGIVGEKFQSYLVQIGPSIEKDFVEGSDEIKPISTAAMFLFASVTFPNSVDWKKFFQKHLQEPFKKVVAVPVGSSVLWIPEVFLNKFGSRLFDSKNLQLATTNRANYLQSKTSSLPKEVASFTLQVGTWSIRLQQVFYSRALNQLQIDDLSKRCNLLLQGLKFAQNLSQNFRLTVSNCLA